MTHSCHLPFCLTWCPRIHWPVRTSPETACTVWYHHVGDVRIISVIYMSTLVKLNLGKMLIFEPHGILWLQYSNWPPGGNGRFLLLVHCDHSLCTTHSKEVTSAILFLYDLDYSEKIMAKRTTFEIQPWSAALIQNQNRKYFIHPGKFLRTIHCGARWAKECELKHRAASAPAFASFPVWLGVLRVQVETSAPHKIESRVQKQKTKTKHGESM